MKADPKKVAEAEVKFLQEILAGNKIKAKKALEDLYSTSGMSADILKAKAEHYTIAYSLALKIGNNPKDPRWEEVKRHFEENYRLLTDLGGNSESS